MKWAQMETAQPGLAVLARELLIEPGVVLIGSTRRDGTPRISPVEPFLLDQELWLGMLWGSAKAADPLHDPRVLVHSIVTSRDGKAGEFKLRGIARVEERPPVLRRYADTVGTALGWRPEVDRLHLFAVDITSAAYLAYDPPTLRPETSRSCCGPQGGSSSGEAHRPPASGSRSRGLNCCVAARTARSSATPREHQHPDSAVDTLAALTAPDGTYLLSARPLRPAAIESGFLPLEPGRANIVPS